MSTSGSSTGHLAPASRSRRRIARLGAVALLAATMLVTFAHPVGAQTDTTQPAPPAEQRGGWGVAPADGDRDFFSLALAPGQSLTDTVAITNTTQQPLKLAIYAKDATNTRDGDLSLLPDKTKDRDAATWIRFGIADYTIPPLTAIRVPFQVSVPLSATPGDHTAGIVAAPVDAPATPAGEDSALNTRLRIGTRVFIRVAGPLAPALRVDRLDVEKTNPVLPPLTGGSTGTVTYEITNTGNQRLSPVAKLELSGMFGQTIKSFAPFKVAELLPGQTIAKTVPFKDLTLLGRVSANLDVTAGAATTSTSSTFWIIPWPFVVLVVLIAGGILAWWLRRRRRARRSPEPDSPEPERPREPAAA